MKSHRVGELRVLEAGHGPMMLCLHGIGSSAGSFAPQIDALSDAYRVVAWDAPGYGESDDPPDDIDMDGYARRASSVAAEADSTVALVGVSWGGVIASRVALTRPDLVSALVLIGSSAGSGVDPERAASMQRRAEDLVTRGVATYAGARVPRLLSPSAPPELVEQVRENMIESVRASGFLAATRSMAATDHRADLPSLRVPTMVIAGVADDVTGPSDAHVLSQLIPGAELVLVPDAGHLVNQEQPGACNTLLRDFLARGDVCAAHEYGSSNDWRRPSWLKSSTSKPSSSPALPGVRAATKTGTRSPSKRAPATSFVGPKFDTSGRARQATTRLTPRTIPPMNLTLSNMLLPPGAIGPEHVHDDAEEVFFVLEGTLEVSLHRGDDVATRTLGYRDAISVPPGVGRSLHNPGTEDALFCVIIGAPKPKLPWYPESSPVHGVTR